MAERHVLNVNFDNLTEEERNQLLALVKKLMEEKKVWKPKLDEKYYYIQVNGNTNDTSWDDSLTDNLMYSIGNCYHTREDAQFAVEKLKVITELKRFAEEHNDKIDWNDGHWKYYLAYDCSYKKIIICSTISIQRADVYFSSSEIAHQAIKEIDSGILKKYYLEVED